MLSGISGQNIRYYEKQGLISPKRNRINSYREYGEEDIRILKTIRMLRMLDMPIEQIRLILKGDLSMGDALDMQKVRLDMPIEQIRLILKGDLSMGDALDMQKVRLQVQAKKLQSAISFCEQMGKEKRTLKELDIDSCLEQMEKNTARDGYFTRWVEDYKKIAREEAQRVFTFIPDDAVTNPREFTNALLAYAKKIAREEAQRVFTFIPDDAVTNPREFTNALLAYAKEKNLNLVITKEGMYPEFEIDGVEYRAERNYGRAYRVPVAVIHCEMIHPELYEIEMEPKRRRWVKILYHSLPALGFIKILYHSLPALGFIFLIFLMMGGTGGLSLSEFFTTKEGVILLILIVILGISEFMHFYLLYRNMDGPR